MQCVQDVTNALEPLPGVAEVHVDFDRKQATLTVDAQKFGGGAVAIDALRAIGKDGAEAKD